MKNTTILLALSLIGSTIMTSCSKEGCTDPRATNYDADATEFNESCVYDIDDSYDIPTAYTFDNVSYSGQTTRLQLLDALVDKIGEAANGTTITAAELTAIFENTNSLFSSTKQLANKTFNSDKSLFTDWFAELETATSQSTGQTIDGRYYTADGVEIKQMVEKGLMGAVFYYQATSSYLENLATDDNATVEAGKGTDMEHHFDEAFGYFGAPINFATNDATKGDFTTTSWYWGKYCISRDAVLANRGTLFTAFLTARAAISNEDYTVRDAQVTVIRNEWEKLVAANVVHYINSVKADIAASNTGDKYHHWSEGKAFAMCLKYNIAKKISDSNWTIVDNAFGANPGAVAAATDFDSALQTIQSVYGFTDSQMGSF